MKNFNFFGIFFHIAYFQQHALVGRCMHTATLIGTKIYIFGGSIGGIGKDFNGSNDFFYLDISKPFDKATKALPFVDLSDKASGIPPHFGAATSAFGKPEDSIFFFGGDMRSLNDQSRLAYSFNTTQSEW